MATKRNYRKKTSTRGSKKYVNEEWKEEVGSEQSQSQSEEQSQSQSQSQEQLQSQSEEQSQSQSQAETKTQSKPEPLIHILVRTHQRPEYFRECIESIAAQEYERKVVHVIVDDAASEKYANEALADGLCDEVLRVNPGSYSNQFKDFNAVLKEGFVIGKRDFRRCPYNLYLNTAMDKIDDGYVFIVDDDKTLPDPMLLNRISKKLGEDKMVIGQYVLKDRTVPVGEHWKKTPFMRAHIDMSCVVFHSNHKKLARQDGHKAGDWRMANRMVKKLKPVWMKEPFVLADNNGNSGRSEQKINKK